MLLAAVPVSASHLEFLMVHAFLWIAYAKTKVCPSAKALRLLCRYAGSMLLEAHKWHMKQYIEVVKDITSQQLRVRAMSTQLQITDLVCCTAPHFPMQGLELPALLHKLGSMQPCDMVLAAVATSVFLAGLCAPPVREDDGRGLCHGQHQL